MSEEIYAKLRGMVRRVTVKNIKDDGQMQTASVEVADGIWRDDIEIMQPYGFSSLADDDGALGLVLAVGGDEGDLVLLPLANPSQRMGGLNKGDVGISNKHGDKVVVRAGGGIEVAAAASISLKVGGVSLTIDAAGFHFDGGGMWNDGVPVDKTHVHGGVVHGSEQTDPPIG